MFPRPSSQIADYHEAQRFQDTYDHYLKPGLVTVAGLTGQNHVAALVVKTVTEAGQEQRKRGVTDGESVFAWSRLRLPPSGAVGVALLRDLLVKRGVLPHLPHSALMTEAWFRVGMPIHYQPVGFRLSYAHRHIPGDGAENFEDLTFRLVRSRLADHFRARAGYLEETAAAASVNRGLVVPSLFKETDGRLTWNQPFVTHSLMLGAGGIESVPGVHIDTIDVSLPSSDFNSSDSSANIDVEVTVYGLDALMAYELGLLWLHLDPKAMPTFPVRKRTLRASANIFNLLLMNDIRKADPEEPLCDLRQFAACAEYVAEHPGGPGRYRLMYEWVQRELGKPTERKELARLAVNGWKLWPSLHSEKFRDTERASNRAAVQADLCDAFELIYDLITAHPPRTNHPHAAHVPVSRDV